ncbi:MAG TPA: hypothetical protein VG917_02860 [Patescibacteria group bacterium]|nr:hypothetical protein [Patescibacteria group bacterium]
MSKPKFNFKYSLENKNTDPYTSIEVLKKAWEDLPEDFTFGERSLFIELAERIIKITETPGNRSN